MNTRFGGVSKNKQQQQIKTALIVCGLLLLVLLAALFVLVQSPAPSQSAATEGASSVELVNTPTQATASKVRVMVTRQRIEEGTQIVETMFEAADWDPSNVPSGAILEDSFKPLLATKSLYAAYMMGPRVPLLESSVTESAPISAIDIPPGHRAVTILINKRTGVEGWAKPNTRVDVLWTHVWRDGKKRVSVLVPYAKVLSVSGPPEDESKKKKSSKKDEATTATLLVTTQQAKKIELARALGELSLSLVGNVEPVGETEGGDPVTEADLFGSVGLEREEEIPADGVMYDTDPTTGKKRKFVLINGRWKAQDE